MLHRFFLFCIYTFYFEPKILYINAKYIKIHNKVSFYFKHMKQLDSLKPFHNVNLLTIFLYSKIFCVSFLEYYIHRMHMNGIETREYTAIFNISRQSRKECYVLFVLCIIGKLFKNHYDITLFNFRWLLITAFDLHEAIPHKNN